MKNYLTLFLFLITLTTYAQGKYQQGYFIDMNNNRVNCFIKDIDKAATPEKFDYRLTEGGERLTGTINTIKEFGIGDRKKYVRATIKLDKSLYHTTDIGRFSNEKSPVFEEVTVFLNVLVDGDASLYMYEYGSLRRYFFKTTESEIYPLVYKKYVFIDEGFGSTDQLKENKEFHQQLFNQVNCGNMQAGDIMKISYTRRELVKHFDEYNTCKGIDYVNYDSKQTQTVFNVNLRPGIALGEKVFNGGRWDGKFENKMVFRFGVEFEILLPFHKNKLAIIIEPNYINYKSENVPVNFQVTETGSSVVNLSSYYEAIEVPVGLRYYFYLNSDSKLFVNAAYLPSSTINSKITREGNDITQLGSPTGYAFGAGYNFNNKYAVEVQYSTRETIYQGPGSLMNTNFNAISILLSYNLF
jgi:hypothetical protein